MPDPDLHVTWFMLPGQRPFRELHWLSRMPGAAVTAVGEPRPPEQVGFLARRYRQPTRRFVEAGALAWLRGLDSLPAAPGWLASLELCSLVTGQVSALARRRRQRQAVLVWANDPGTPLYRLPPYRQALRRARSADLFLCFVEAARRHCLALGLEAERCAVVLPGVDTELFHPPAEPVAEPVALFASPLASNKGIDRVLEAHRLVRRRLPEARLAVLGRGPLEGLVRREAERPDSGVRFLGAGDRERVASTLRRSAVFVTAPRPTPVWNEQFGLAYIEAMASGLPVVTTICGSNHEAVREPNLRVPDDAEALAEALLRFLGDPDRRARTGEANRRTVLERHQLDRQCQRLGEVFRRFSRR
ncbi:MAG TPA: glycosyltransferase family 4 protein [Actinomycetota bacterium]|nr:glycosyltransferase family 4 protein [Actinomycetota bacterium]